MLAILHHLCNMARGQGVQEKVKLRVANTSCSQVSRHASHTLHIDSAFRAYCKPHGMQIPKLNSTNTPWATAWGAAKTLQTCTLTKWRRPNQTHHHLTPELLWQPNFGKPLVSRPKQARLTSPPPPHNKENKLNNSQGPQQKAPDNDNNNHNKQIVRIMMNETIIRVIANNSNKHANEQQ